jgi:hypothetical protein
MKAINATKVEVSMYYWPKRINIHRENIPTFCQLTKRSPSPRSTGLFDSGEVICPTESLDVGEVGEDSRYSTKLGGLALPHNVATWPERRILLIVDFGIG